MVIFSDFWTFSDKTGQILAGFRLNGGQTLKNGQK